MFGLFLSIPEMLSAQDLRKELVMAVGLSIPPYVFRDSNSGMELDIIREALKVAGYTITPKYLPLKRIRKALKSGIVDGALTVKETMGIESAYFADKSHIYYQNIAVSLKENQLDIQDIMGLKDYSIIVFQNADDYVGGKWLEMKKMNTKWIRETANQENQVAMLFRKRTEVIILDINIFKYYRQRTKKTDTSLPVVFHEVVPKNHVKVAFISKQVRDDYNRGFSRIVESGVYQKIIEKYIGNTAR